MNLRLRTSAIPRAKPRSSGRSEVTLLGHRSCSIMKECTLESRTWVESNRRDSSSSISTVSDASSMSNISNSVLLTWPSQMSITTSKQVARKSLSFEPMYLCTSSHLSNAHSAMTSISCLPLKNWWKPTVRAASQRSFAHHAVNKSE